MRCCWSCISPCELLPSDKLDTSQEVDMPPPLDWEIYAEDVYTGDCHECTECGYGDNGRDHSCKGSDSSLDMRHAGVPRVVAVNCASETDAMSVTGSLSTRRSPAPSSSSDVTDGGSQAFHSCYSGLNTLAAKGTNNSNNHTRFGRHDGFKEEQSGHYSSVEGDNSKHSSFTSNTTDRDSPDSGVCVFEEEILAVSKCRMEASMLPGDRTRLETYDSATLSPGAMTDDSDSHQQEQQKTLLGTARGEDDVTPRRPGSSVRERCTELERLFVAREKAARRLQRKALFHHAQSAPSTSRQSGESTSSEGKEVAEMNSLETAVSGALKTIFSDLAVSAVQRLSTIVSGIRTSQVVESTSGSQEGLHEKLMRPSLSSEVGSTSPQLTHTGLKMSATIQSGFQVTEKERVSYPGGSRHRRNYSRHENFSKQGFNNLAYNAGQLQQQWKGMDGKLSQEAGELDKGGNSEESKHGLLPIPHDFGGLPPNAFLGRPALARPGLLPTPAMPPSQGCIPKGVGTQFLQPILPKHPKGVLLCQRQEGPHPQGGRRRPQGSRRGRQIRGPEGMTRSRSQDNHYPHRRRYHTQGQAPHFSRQTSNASSAQSSENVLDESFLPPAVPVTEEMLAEAQRLATMMSQLSAPSQAPQTPQTPYQTPRLLTHPASAPRLTIRHDYTPRPNSTLRHDSTLRHNSTVRHDSTPHRDSTIHRDITPHRDAIPNRVIQESRVKDITPVQSTPMVLCEGKLEPTFQEIPLSEILPVKARESKLVKPTKPKTNFLMMVKGGLSNLFRST